MDPPIAVGLLLEVMFLNVKLAEGEGALVPGQVPGDCFHVRERRHRDTCFVDICFLSALKIGIGSRLQQGILRRFFCLCVFPACRNPIPKREWDIAAVMLSS
jgi:hypothetical protein